MDTDELKTFALEKAVQFGASRADSAAAVVATAATFYQFLAEVR